MPTNFPTNPDTYTTKVDGVDNVMAAHVNDLQDATTAIEQALLGDIPDGNVQYVKKAASSTDNAIPRFDGTDGKKIQNSGVTVDDSNNIMVGSLPVPTSVATSTDNAIPRFDGTDGKKLQNSGVIINDNGQLSGNGLDGWIYDTDTWTYVSATSFKITGKDVRYRFPEGTKIKLVQSGSTKYFYVIATAYTSGNTTITITGGSDYALANATISGQAYSYAAAPQNFPQWFNYTPIIYTGWSDLPTGTYKFYAVGNTCFYNIDQSDGTSNGATTRLGTPITAAGNQVFSGACGLAVDNGAILTGAARWYIDKSSTWVQFQKDMGTTSFTTSGTKRVRALVIYEF